MKTLITLTLFISTLTFQNFAFAQNSTISYTGFSPCSINCDNMVCHETDSAPQARDLTTITDRVTLQFADSNEEFDSSLNIQTGGILELPSSSDKIDITESGRALAIKRVMKSSLVKNTDFTGLFRIKFYFA
ncbi:MAG: hypothetical protein KTR26_07800 [Flammeovirgaceae bacterium]|nr:hypothetical protein [Flammeovirgaceae bacterium]